MAAFYDLHREHQVNLRRDGWCEANGCPGHESPTPLVVPKIFGQNPVTIRVSLDGTEHSVPIPKPGDTTVLQGFYGSKAIITTDTDWNVRTQVFDVQQLIAQGKGATISIPQVQSLQPHTTGVIDVPPRLSVYPVKPPAYKHQLDGVRAALEAYQAGRPGLYLNHCVGAGKTRTALGVAKLMPAHRILVLCPLVALGVWDRESGKWWNDAETQILHGDWPATLVDNSVPDGFSTIPWIYFTNYDQLLNPARLKTLLAWKPNLLILDEAHYVKSPTVARTRAVLKISKASKFRLLLSGTPAHDPLDWWQQMRIVAPYDAMWSQTFGNYKQHIAVLGGPDKTWVQGFRDDLVARVKEQCIAPYTHVVDRSQLKLPYPVETIIPVTLGDKARKAYDELERDFVTLIERNDVAPADPLAAPHVLARMTALLQLCGGFVPDSTQPYHTVPKNISPIDTAKLDATLELIRQRPGQKIVIACRFLMEIEFLRQRINTENIGVTGIIQGGTAPQVRTEVEDWFQNDSTKTLPHVILLQNESGGVAITLSKADTLIQYSLSTSAITFEQIRGRIDRPGKPDFQEILVLVAAQTIEEKLLSGLRDKLMQTDLTRAAYDDAKRRTHVSR